MRRLLTWLCWAAKWRWRRVERRLEWRIDWDGRPDISGESLLRFSMWDGDIQSGYSLSSWPLLGSRGGSIWRMLLRRLFEERKWGRRIPVTGQLYCPPLPKKIIVYWYSKIMFLTARMEKSWWNSSEKSEIACRSWFAVSIIATHDGEISGNISKQIP